MGRLVTGVCKVVVSVLWVGGNKISNKGWGQEILSGWGADSGGDFSGHIGNIVT